MMKHNVITWMAAACIAFAAHAQRPLRWVADATQTAPVTFDCSRGETLTFAPVLKAYGTTLTNYTASFQWQTNGMGGLFWSTNALVFAPSMDVGASRYRFWIRAESTNGVMYSAQGTINMLHGPGAIVNALPLPVQHIDFSAVSVTNAPWLLSTDLDPVESRVEGVEANTNAWNAAASWGDHAAAGYLVSSAWLSWLTTNTYVKVESDPVALAAIANYLPLAGGSMGVDATITLQDFYSETVYGLLSISRSAPPFGINNTMAFPDSETGTVTFATREWARDYVRTNVPSGPGIPSVWTNMVWGASGTNAIYRMSWDVTNGTIKVEEILP